MRLPRVLPVVFLGLIATVDPPAQDARVLDADPRADIRNVTRINQTFRGGVAYQPVDPAKPVGRGFVPR